MEKFKTLSKINAKKQLSPSDWLTSDRIITLWYGKKQVLIISQMNTNPYFNNAILIFGLIMGLKE